MMIIYGLVGEKERVVWMDDGFGYLVIYVLFNMGTTVVVWVGCSCPLGLVLIELSSDRER